MTLTRRDLLRAGAASSLVLVGCGDSDPRLNPQAKALARRSVAVDYASYYAPIEDVRRLAQARAAEVGAALTLSQDPDGAAAQLDNLKRWTGPRGGFRAIAVAPVDPAAVADVVAATDRDVAVVAYIDEIAGARATITVDRGRAGRLLAQEAQRRGPGGRVLVVGPPPSTRFGAGFAAAANAIGQVADVAGTVTALAQADAEQAVRKALDGSGARTVLTWNDTTALGAADALGADGWVGGLGAPSLTSAAALDALRGDGPLRCLVAARLTDLAAALVDVPFALAKGRTSTGREVPMTLLRPRSAATDRFAREFRR